MLRTCHRAGCRHHPAKSLVYSSPPIAFLVSAGEIFSIAFGYLLPAYGRSLDLWTRSARMAAAVATPRRDDSTYKRELCNIRLASAPHHSTIAPENARTSLMPTPSTFATMYRRRRALPWRARLRDQPRAPAVTRGAAVRRYLRIYRATERLAQRGPAGVEELRQLLNTSFARSLTVKRMAAISEVCQRRAASDLAD